MYAYMLFLEEKEVYYHSQKIILSCHHTFMSIRFAIVEGLLYYTKSPNRLLLYCRYVLK